MAAAAAAAAAALSGCGTNLSEEEFRSEANAACRAAVADVPARSGLRGLEGEALRETAGALKMRVREVESRLKGIVPPRELAPEYGELIIHVSDLVEALEELQDSAGGGDDQRPREVLDDVAGALRKARATAREIGLEECAQAADRALGAIPSPATGG